MNPASAESQALLGRWEDLIRRTTGHDQDLVHGLKSLYSDRDNWPEHFRSAVIPLSDGRILAFVKAAAAARNNMLIWELLFERVTATTRTDGPCCHSGFRRI